MVPSRASTEPVKFGVRKTSLVLYQDTRSITLQRPARQRAQAYTPSATPTSSRLYVLQLVP